MSTMTLAPVVPRYPVWTLEVFNTVYTPTSARSGYYDGGYDPLRCGWYSIVGNKDAMWNIDKINHNVYTNSVGNCTVDIDDSWLLGLEMFLKSRAPAYFPVAPDISLPVDSKVVINVDLRSLDTAATGTGTASITGNVDEDELVGAETNPVTDTVTLTGQGIHISDRTFTSVTSIDVDMAEGNTYCMVSAWYSSGSVQTRECRVYCDTNGDGISGLVFGGYIRENSRERHPMYGDVKYSLIGYKNFLQSNEYVAGYRSLYRCSHYSKTGVSGACDVDPTPTCWQSGADGCYVGDYYPIHPTGVVVTSADHKCPNYSAGTERLPHDGYQYYEDYAPSAETGYCYYPDTYFSAIRAVVAMCNSIEDDSIVSREWGLANHAVYELSSGVGTSGSLVLTGYAYTIDLNVNSYIIVDNECMKVTSVTAGTGETTNVGVLRALFNTVAASHDAGASVEVPVIGCSPDGVDVNALCVKKLTESNIKHTIADTLKSHSDNALSEISETEFVGWVDPFKQIRFTELLLAGIGDDGAGNSATLRIAPGDVLDAPTMTLSPVTNKVSSKVYLDDSHWIYGSLTAEEASSETGFSGYDTSVELFGRYSEEVNNKQINALAPTSEKTDFKSFALNYLKTHAFPVLTQVIKLDCFVPDEHYWVDVDTSSDLTKPFLTHSDVPNEYIDILCTTVECPDFWLPKVDGAYQYRDFTVTGLKHVMTGPGNFETYLTLKRYTTPGDYT